MSSPGSPEAKPVDPEAPKSLEAEEKLLGSLLVSDHEIDVVMQLVRGDDFAEPAHRVIFDAMRALHDGGRSPNDVYLLREQIEEHAAGTWEQWSLQRVLGRAANSVTHAGNVVYYAEFVRDRSVQRQLIDAAGTIAEYGREGGARGELQAIVDRCEHEIYAVAGRLADATMQGSRSVHEILTEAMETISERQANSHQLTGVPTGLCALDNWLGGFQPRQLVVIGARPGTGKTALGLQIAMAASSRGHQTLIASLEMAQQELADRMLASESGASLYRLLRGFLRDDERQGVIRAAQEIAQWALWVHDKPHQTISEINAVARRHKREHGLDLLVVDYLQHVQPDRRSDPRQEQVAKISRRCKIMARELDIAVVCLAQVNRDSTEGGKMRAPKLSELRESGAIEQDADVVLLLHRPPLEEDQEAVDRSAVDPAELHVAKNRHGPAGLVRLNWRGQCARFEDWRDEGEEYTEPDDGPPTLRMDEAFGDAPSDEF